MLPHYAELHCASNLSFLRGASHPQELIDRALALGYQALALTDDCSVSGVVRAHLALRQARQHPATAIQALAFKLLVGAEFTVRAPEGMPQFRLVMHAMHREGYGQLCEFITRVRRASPVKGQYQLTQAQVIESARAGRLSGVRVLMALPRLAHEAPEVGLGPDVSRQVAWLRQCFDDRCGLALSLHHEVDDVVWLRTLRALAQTHGVPLVATGDVLMHARSRKPLQDVLTAIRLGKPLPECGWALRPHAEQHLRSRLSLSQRYPPDTLQAACDWAAQCHFSLDELRYEYPEEVVPEGQSPASHLRQLTYEGVPVRFPQGLPEGVRAQIEHELALITELGYEKYFLTVHDIVRFARGQGILCQGRGSAANSAVCYCLGITEVDPSRTSVLFERFISKERNEPPDIDVDFEHQRREEVIQYLYRKYGRDRTALTATLISYQKRSALRDVGKALGFDAHTIAQASGNVQWWDGMRALPERLAEIGLDPADRRVQQWMELTAVLVGFPRHLSQHTGGFVIARDLLCRMVPIENAAMPDRSVIQWDKDDLDALGLLKVDVLALGMLTALRLSLDLIAQRRGQPPGSFRLQDIPAEDPATYDMICQADTIGVFQIESRAQMSMLPRLRPRRFYDLVIEVALVRPGPIQGGMVHPYLRRRQGLEAIDYPKGLEPALERTLGVPIFQEQVMQVAVIAAGFSPGEADALRRAMAAWRRKGAVDRFYNRIVQGMRERGYSEAFAEQIFKQIEGFGSYGFPESHAASFALLVYASAWVKCHEPAAFLCGLLNAQPLGFYSPSQLVQDARRHGVQVLPPDVQHSDWLSTLEPATMCTSEGSRDGRAEAPLAVRLGLHLVAGVSQRVGEAIVAARRQVPEGALGSVDALVRSARLEQAEVRALAAADALRSLAGHRRQQVWEASAQHRPPALLREAPVHEAPLVLPESPEGENIVHDYATLGLTLRRHPLALLRPMLAAERLLSAAQLHDFPNGRLARACGIVTVRQQPGTASGVVFVTLEDETGNVNVIVWPHLKEKQRRELVHARLLAVYGVWQREGEVRHLVAHRLRDLTPWLGRLNTHSRDFH
ncbi:error-prone DNA polymerase [Aquabacterium lacunae]|uniref:error-prone DNA polymerase n=1 Tax=Aquabacterium lacunae TaxID=2528630 RepID=UPI001FE02EEA|nr:error-prone DNA polymerase [Aquabacterium lacunae]